MARHIEAWLDGVPLSSVGPVILSQVWEDPAELEITEAERPGRPGSRLLGIERSSLKVSIEAVIRELYDLPRRAQTLEALAAWCQGGVLELSNRPSRRLRVVCTSAPALGAVRDYTSQLRMEFTAYDVPYWEDQVPTSLALSGTDVSGVFSVPGTAKTPMSVSVTPTGGTLTALTVTVGDETIQLTGLSVARNGLLTLERSARDDLVIASGGVSLLSRRTAASADDLMPAPGRRAIGAQANTACSFTFSAYGRWA